MPLRLPSRRPTPRFVSRALFVASVTILTTQAAPLRVGYLYGSLEYNANASLHSLAAELDSTRGTKSFFFAGKDRDEGSAQATPTVIANINDLDSLDVLVIFTRRMWMNPAQTAKLQAFVNSGKGLVGLRTASHGIQSWSEGRGLDSVWGGAYNDHGEKTGYTVALTTAAQSSPLFTGVVPWTATGGLYRQNLGGASVVSGATIYLTGTDLAGAVHPTAWSRVRSGANVFYTSSGTQEDFQKPGYRKMVMNAILWAGGQVVPVRAGAGVATRPPEAKAGRVTPNRVEFSRPGGPKAFTSNGRAVRSGDRPSVR